MVSELRALNMAGTPMPAGKLPVELLERVLGTFGAQPTDVRLGPAVGEDACALDVGGGVLIAAMDPVTLTASDIGRYAVVVNANDVAVCGVRPRWFLATVLLPVATAEESVEPLFATIREALDEIGAALVGGHTEVTTAVNQPVIVGQMLGLSSDGRFVTTSGAAPGDIVVQVGVVPIEGAAVLSAEAGERLGDVPPHLVEDARRATRDPGISVVEAAMAAASLGATAMHDPTEGGLASGLHELSVAGSVGIRVDRDAVLWFEPGLAVCRALGADPWATLASGSLLATFPEELLAGALDGLAAGGHGAAVIGVVESGTGVRATTGESIAWPARDEVARVLAP